MVKDSQAPEDISIDFSFLRSFTFGSKQLQCLKSLLSLLSDRDCVIALNSSNFSVDWEFKSARLSALVATQRIL